MGLFHIVTLAYRVWPFVHVLLIFVAFIRLDVEVVRCLPSLVDEVTGKIHESPFTGGLPEPYQRQFNLFVTGIPASFP